MLTYVLIVLVSLRFTVSNSDDEHILSEYDRIHDDSQRYEDMLFDPLPRRHKRNHATISSRDQAFCQHNCLNGRCVHDSFSNSVLCQCIVGYDGEMCSRLVSNCNKTRHLCGGHGMCINQVGTHVCQCETQDRLYNRQYTTRTIFGHTCKDAVSNPCSEKDLEPELAHLAQRSFHPLVGSRQSFVQCILDSFLVRRCPYGQQWNQQTLSCVSLSNNHIDQKKGICAREPCLNGGTCRLLDTNSRDLTDQFVCDCVLPYKGRFCNERIDMCDLNNHTTFVVTNQRSHPPNRCGDKYICLNSDTYPYFSCVCGQSIVSQLPCSIYSNEPENRCCANVRRYSLQEKTTNRLWVECDEDDVGFVKICQKGQKFSDSLQICTS
ncbi:hypothetical protein GJ496_003639 [Pomphorhynchus laevis]|nr:hypothetical protein GJ496_003639 [Pomphorhynchus laevis]